MFVQSESFDLFTAQVLHFTRHSPPITRRCHWHSQQPFQLNSFAHQQPSAAALKKGKKMWGEKSKTEILSFRF